MTRFEVIEKHYKLIQQVSRRLTKDWGDFSHDLIEYLLVIETDIVDVDSRDKFKEFINVVAYRFLIKRKKDLFQELKDVAAEDDETIELPSGHPDDIEKLLKLSRQDRIILSIFAQGTSLSEASRRTLIDRRTLLRMLNTARKNAQQALK